MAVICQHCGTEIVKDQHCAETQDQFAKRYNSGYCRKKCERLSTPKPPPSGEGRPRTTLSLISAEYGRGGEAQVKETTPRDAAYLDFVRTFDCVGCGWPAHLGKIEAHHVKTGGMAIKGSDYETVSLCAADARGCHAAADKSPESAKKFIPYSLHFNALWISAGHKIKKRGE